MKSSAIISLGVLLALLITTGCQPKLAESPYGAREQHWEAFIKDTYPDWEPPQTEPPSRKTAVTLEDAGPQIISEDAIIIDTGYPIDKLVADHNIESAEMEITSEFQTYTVQKGDTLWSISRKFYGTGKNWRNIFKANQDIISNPDKVKAGAELRIPANQ